MSPPLQPRLNSRFFNATHYIECGPADGPLMMFLHGWPSIALMWRAQMEALSEDGWHCIAPDLRGYGSFAAPDASGAYAIEHIVADMAALHDHLGGQTCRLGWPRLGQRSGRSTGGAPPPARMRRCFDFTGLFPRR